MRIVKPYIAVLSLVLTMLFSASLWAEDAAKGVSGTWKWEVQGRNGAQEVTLKLKQDGEKVTGSITGMGGQEAEIQEGTIKGNELVFKVTREFNGQKTITTYTLTIAGDEIKGKSEQVSTRDITGKRAAE